MKVLFFVRPFSPCAHSEVLYIRRVLAGSSFDAARIFFGSTGSFISLHVADNVADCVRRISFSWFIHLFALSKLLRMFVAQVFVASLCWCVVGCFGARAPCRHQTLRVEPCRITPACMAILRNLSGISCWLPTSPYPSDRKRCSSTSSPWVYGIQAKALSA